MDRGTRRRRNGLRFHAHPADSGVGMITVIGFASAIMIVVALSASIAVNSLESSRGHVQFEAAIATAETGLAETLGRIQAANDAGGEYASPTNCTASWTWPSTTLPTAAAERVWAETAIAGIVADHPECVTPAGQGEYVAFRARNQDGNLVPVVYSLGWSPSRTSSEFSQRLVKVEYLFSPYKPNQAILTESNLVFSGSVTVDIATGSTATSADIHTNGDLNAGNNSLQVAGNVTASGSNSKDGECPINGKITGTCTASSPPQAVPVISARKVYKAASGSTAQSWYDLCPDGTIKAPDPDGTDPCTGEVIAASGPFRGWTLEDEGTYDAVWVFTPTSGTDYPGAYYAYQTDMRFDKGQGNKNYATLSAIAESKPNGHPGNAATCNKSGGNMQWDHTYITNYVPGLMFVADGTITASANSENGTGIMAAGDALLINTSSNTFRGALIASNVCAGAGTNDIQGITVEFDSSSEVPLGSLIRTTQWLELTGQ